MNKKNVFTFVYPDFDYSINKKGEEKFNEGGWYSEGIAQLTAIIEDMGWEVNLLHINKPISDKEFQRKLSAKNPDIIGFSIRTGVWKKAKDYVRLAGEMGKFLIAGSYHPSLWPEQVIQWEGINAICVGEGENPIKELIKAYPDKKKLQKVGSCWVKDEKGNVIKNKVLPMETDLDCLPIPKFEIFDFKKLFSSKIKTATVVLTRGCPYNCTYCWNNFARNLYPNKSCYIRCRSPKNCLEYITKVKMVYPELQSFRFQDDLWPFQNNWFDDFSELYIKNFKIKFECHLRANLLTDKIVKRLKEMGCFGLYLGVESGNDYIRNKILKRYMTREQITDAFDICHKYSMRIHAYNIIGIPHEDMRMALDTIKLNARIRPTDMFFFIFFPYAGTELSNIGIEAGFFKEKDLLEGTIDIKMPKFPDNQIKFASYYGRMFTRLYQFNYKLPSFLKRSLDKILDWLWLFNHKPFRLLFWLFGIYRRAEENLKLFIKRYFFQVYLWTKR